MRSGSQEQVLEAVPPDGARVMDLAADQIGTVLSRNK
jgi:hypothetical protein